MKAEASFSTPYFTAAQDAEVESLRIPYGQYVSHHCFFSRQENGGEREGGRGLKPGQNLEKIG
jgi:hypothetical protein